MTSSDTTREAFDRAYNKAFARQPVDNMRAAACEEIWQAATAHLITLLQSEGIVEKVAEEIDDVHGIDSDFIEEAKAAIQAIIEKLK